MPRRRKKDSLPPGCTWTRHGTIAWRYTDPSNPSKRPQRSTGTKDPAIAARIIAAWQEEIERKRAGLPDYAVWRADLAPLAEAWLEALTKRCKPGSSWPKQCRTNILRVIAKLGLQTTGDLLDIGRLNKGIQGLNLSDVTARRLYQDPLRALSKWLAEDHRVLEYDPLGSWRPIQYERVRVVRRAFLPSEVALALWGARALAQLRGWKRDLSLLWRVLLVTAPRIESLCERDVRHYRHRQKRIDFGKGPKNKRRGAGSLDDETAAEIEEHILDRDRRDPLLPSPRGKRLAACRVLDWWRESFGLGALAELVPDEDIGTLYAALRTLTAPMKHNRRDAPKPLRADSAALAIVEDFGEEWAARMQGVDVHSFKKTHRTWARAKGVASEAIDVQLGHATGDPQTLAVIRSITGTGAKHYTDFTAFDPRASACAVREVLADAERDLQATLDEHSGAA